MLTIAFLVEYMAEPEAGLQCVVDINVETMEEACELFKLYYASWFTDADIDDEIPTFSDWCMTRGIQCREINCRSAVLQHWSDGELSWRW